MNTASSIPAFQGNHMPLSNLFAYIRDLFDTTDPIYRFRDTKQVHWKLEDWSTIASSQSPDIINIQWSDPYLPWLTLQKTALAEVTVPAEIAHWVAIIDHPHAPSTLSRRKEIVIKFEQDSDRVDAFDAFAPRIQGKSLEEVREVEIPDILRGWIDLSLVDEQISIQRKDRIEKFDADDHRVQMVETFERVFNNNQQQNWYAAQINELYESLHTLYYELTSHPQAQLYLSFGMVSGEIGGEKYQNHLFHFPLQLKLTKQQIRIEADPLAQAVICEQHLIPLLEKHFSEESSYSIQAKQDEVLKQVDLFNSNHVPLQWDIPFVKEKFHKTAENILKVFPKVHDQFLNDREINLSFYSDVPKDEIALSFSPVIQVKKEEPRFHIARDASRIIDIIEELVEQKRQDEVPVYFQKLFTASKQDHPIHIVHKRPAPVTQTVSTPEVLPRVLFPLPYNQEQKAIAYRLEEQDAVTIQGPPGTGKSHTIANIASHYVAQGKSILIVSKNAKALEVIRNKLPDTLKPLAVSWMESDNNIEQLKYAIDALKDHLSRPYSQKEVQECEDRLQECEAKLDESVEALQRLFSLHEQRITLENPYTAHTETKLASEWAKWLINYPVKSQYLKEYIPSEWYKEIPVWIAEYIELAFQVPETYLSLTPHEYPDPINWISPDVLTEYCEQLKDISRQIDITDYKNIPVYQIDQSFLQRWEVVENYLETLDQSQDYIQQPNFDFIELAHMFSKHHHVIHAARKNFWEHEWDLSPVEDEEPETLLEQALGLKKKFGDQRQLSLLKRTTLSKIQKKLLSCKIDRLAVDNIDQLELLTEYLDHLYHQKSLSILLGNYFQYLQVDWNPQDWRSHTERLMGINHAWEGISHFNEYLNARNLPQLVYHDDDYNADVAFIAGLGLYKQYHDIKDKLHQSLASLRLTHTYSAPFVKDLLVAAEQWDDALYKELLNTYEEEREMVGKARRSKEILEKIHETAPLTAEHLVDQFMIHKSDQPILKDEVILDVSKEFFHQQLRKQLNSVVSDVSLTDKYLANLRFLQRQQEKLVEELIAYRTWHHKIASITDDERAALTAWRNDLINIGKGQGKNSSRNMAAAIDNMQRAKSVVPIWIMQQDTAIKFFANPRPGQFDLLIVDEASQCDISMLNLIFRSKKCMIVGDENQTATALPPSQFPIDRTNQILDRYLRHHPFREQFNINNRTSSIYALSGVIYPNIITLLEHFRCRPEIIGYSNQYVYNRQLVPLKTASHDQYGQPLEVYYVEEDTQNKKRTKIVEKVNEILDHTIDQYEQGLISQLPTIGVLTLDSSNDYHQEQLIKVLSRNPRIRQYEDQLALIIGTARKFQGDERDMMILTSTAIHRKNAKGNLRPPRASISEEMMRIYNVAASRAREKAILLHCIAPEAVAAMNPNCYRKKLIDYYTLASQVPDRSEVDLPQLLRRTSAAPENYRREVCEFLVENGWGKYINPNHKIGNYQLDFAIIREGKMLAILCDEPERNIPTYLDQQLVLQRVGWKVFYVSEVLWYYQHERCKHHILKWLEDQFTTTSARSD